MMLFMHWVLLQPVNLEQETMYLIVPKWQIPARFKMGLLIEDTEKDSFFRNRGLGRLKKLGMTSPIENGLLYGAMQESSFSWFMHCCDTSGSTEKCTPFERLERFVKTWFAQAPWKLADAELANQIPLLAGSV